MIQFLFLCLSFWNTSNATVISKRRMPPEPIAQVMHTVDRDSLATKEKPTPHIVSPLSTKKRGDKEKGGKQDTYLIFLISSVDISNVPIPTANSLPSAKIATGVSLGSARSFGGSEPPGDVSPGAIMFAPCPSEDPSSVSLTSLRSKRNRKGKKKGEQTAKRKRIAPRSILT